MERILRFIQKYIIPKKVYALGQPIYHYKMALLGAIIYRFPSRQINVVAVTGTKGKTSVVELVGAILEELEVSKKKQYLKISHLSRIEKAINIGFLWYY